MTERSASGNMRIKITLLTTLLLAFSSIGFAQSNKSQQLRRFTPQMQSDEQNSGQERVRVFVEKGIAQSTVQALSKYASQQYESAQMRLGLYRLPGADSLYFVTVMFDDPTLQDTTLPPTTLFILKEQGGTVSELRKSTYNDPNNGDINRVLEPVFFLGQSKLLIIVSAALIDGFITNYVFEYAGDDLKSLDEIHVIENVSENGVYTGSYNPMRQATAEYKNNSYYVTMRGKKSLFNGEKKIAPPGKPITFFYDGKTWRQAGKKQRRRR